MTELSNIAKQDLDDLRNELITACSTWKTFKDIFVATDKEDAAERERLSNRHHGAFVLFLERSIRYLTVIDIASLVTKYKKKEGTNFGFDYVLKRLSSDSSQLSEFPPTGGNTDPDLTNTLNEIRCMAAPIIAFRDKRAAHRDRNAYTSSPVKIELFDKVLSRCCDLYTSIYSKYAKPISMSFGWELLDLHPETFLDCARQAERLEQLERLAMARGGDKDVREQIMRCLTRPYETDVPTWK